MIKVHIISGFLGAGKTTLIKKLLNSIAGKKIIIENEFGDVGIDGEIIECENYDVIELAKGCICCSMKVEFEKTILSVIDNNNPDHIIIEPTGIGMLGDILKVFDKKDIKNKCILSLPITVIDALNYLQDVDEFGGFFKDQIINAGIIVLSKTQLMELDNLSEIIESLKSINKYAEIMTITWDNFTEIEYNELTNIQFIPDKNEIKYVDKIKRINEKFESVSITLPSRYSIKGLENLLVNLSNEENGRIVRAKGFVEGIDGDLEFSYINNRYSIKLNSRHSIARICIIGSNLKLKSILKLFNC